MAPIVGLAALAVAVIVPLWTARAVLAIVLTWLVTHSDPVGAEAHPTVPSAAAAVGK